MTNISQPIPEKQDSNLTTGQQPEFTPQPLPEPPKLPFTFKANLAEYRKRLGVLRIAIALVLLSVIYLRFGYIAGIISTVIIVLVIAIFVLALSKRSITLHEDSIEYRNVFGSTKRIRYGDISMVKVFLAYIEAGFGYVPRVIIGKKAGGFFFSFSALYWKVEDIDLLLATLESKKVINETYIEPAVSSMIAKQFPDYVGVYERHPYWIAFAIVIAIFVAVIGIVLLLM